jgi:hypothetical protein
VAQSTSALVPATIQYRTGTSVATWVSSARTSSNNSCTPTHISILAPNLILINQCSLFKTALFNIQYIISYYMLDNSITISNSNNKCTYASDILYPSMRQDMCKCSYSDLVGCTSHHSDKEHLNKH